MNSLLELFDNLSRPEQCDNNQAIFHGIEIPTRPGFHLGKDTVGRPIMIITGNCDSKGISIELENLEIKHYLRCRISQSSGNDLEGSYSIIHCLSEEKALQEYFLKTLELVLSSNSKELSLKEISLAINRLTELFHALSKPASGTVMGLWGELFIISQAREPELMINAWHSEAEERYDFSAGNQRIEVKCAGGRKREHYFSFEQAYPAVGTTVFVASLFAEKSTGGTTLGELWDHIRSHISRNIELSLKLEKVCISILGTSWQKAINQAYDADLAQESLAYYDILNIPRVSPNQSIGVSEIHFRSNFDLIEPVCTDDYDITDSLFHAGKVF